MTPSPYHPLGAKGVGGHRGVPGGIDVLELARSTAEREPWVLATVVWRRAHTSGRDGIQAAIGADRSVRGPGDACPKPVVVQEVVGVLREGTPRLMFLCSADEVTTGARACLPCPPSDG